MRIGWAFFAVTVNELCRGMPTRKYREVNAVQLRDTVGAAKWRGSQLGVTWGYHERGGQGKRRGVSFTASSIQASAVSLIKTGVNRKRYSVHGVIATSGSSARWRMSNKLCKFVT